MHLLLLAQNFPPEFSGAATMQYELACAAAQAGHRVTVIAPTPRHHMVTADDSEAPLPAGVRVIRVDLPNLDRRSNVRRLIHDVLLQIAFVTKAFGQPRPDVVFGWSPPVPYPLIALLLKLRGSRIGVYMQDPLPEALVSLGIVREGRAAAWLIDSVHNWIYRQCDYIAVHSPRARARFLSHGLDDAKVQLLPLWVDTDFVVPRPRDNAFAKAHGLTGRFVVLYAGTLGYSMGVEELLPAAALRLRQDRDILMAVVGAGSTDTALQAASAETGASNLRLMPLQSRPLLPDVLGSADVLLVVLRKDRSQEPTSYLRSVIPHKVLTNMAAGQPILASCELDSDLADLIRVANCGRVVPPQDPQALADAILQMKAAPAQLAQWGENARRFACAYFSAPDRTRRLTQVLADLGTGTAAAFDNPWEAAPEDRG